MKLHVAIAQFRPVKADPQASLDRVEDILSEAVGGEPPPDLVVFPEASLTGYFLEGGVREGARASADLFEDLQERYARVADPTRPLDVAIGFYELGDRRIYNSALYAELGGASPRIVHRHRKVFLPTYGVFQEERFVESGPGIAAFDTRWGRAAVLICEDAFHSISGTLAALDGAEVIVVLSASPARGAGPGAGLPGNVARWDHLGGAMAAEHGVFVVVSQLVGFEGGKGFAGGSAAYAPSGECLVRGPLWDEALLSVSFDTEEQVSARAEEPLLSDLERSWTRLLLHSPGARVVHGPRPAADAEDAEAGDRQPLRPEPPPPPEDPEPPPPSEDPGRREGPGRPGAT